MCKSHSPPPPCFAASAASEGYCVASILRMEDAMRSCEYLQLLAMLAPTLVLLGAVAITLIAL